jgi:hypothetical protein
MLDHEKFVAPPDVQEIFTELFESPINTCNNCATEMVGWFAPAHTGPHTFRIASDDSSHLWLRGATEKEPLNPPDEISYGKPTQPVGHLESSGGRMRFIQTVNLIRLH